jgi:hypothetical protein
MIPKYIYILDYYVPASHSEGGLLNVIAENDEECFDLVVEWDNETWPEYYGKLRENVMKAPRYLLSEDADSGVIEAFTV